MTGTGMTGQLAFGIKGSAKDFKRFSLLFG